MAKSSAAEFITSQMQDCLPPGAPLSFTIDEARFIGSGRKRVAVAKVTMFDGLPAELEVGSWGGGHKHRWPSMEGGDCCFEVGRWIRVSELDAQASALGREGE